MTTHRQPQQQQNPDKINYLKRGLYSHVLIYTCIHMYINIQDYRPEYDNNQNITIVLCVHFNHIIQDT